MVLCEMPGRWTNIGKLGWIDIQQFSLGLQSLPTDSEVLDSIPDSILEFFSSRELFTALHVLGVYMLVSFPCFCCVLSSAKAPEIC